MTILLRSVELAKLRRMLRKCGAICMHLGAINGLRSAKIHKFHITLYYIYTYYMDTININNYV